MRRGACPFRGKEEILEIPDNVSALPVDGDEITTSGHVLTDGKSVVYLLSVLVEIGDVQMNTAPHRPPEWLKVAEKKAEQCCFS